MGDNRPNFGQTLRYLRKKAKIGSRELSRKIGKGDAYVSHIENGRIKNLDYETAYQLLKNVGYEESEINGFLEIFGIVDPELEEDLLKQLIKKDEEKQRVLSDPDYQVSQFDDWYYEDKKTLYNLLDNINKSLKNLIDHDYSLAYEIIKNLNNLVLPRTKEEFKFFRELMSFDYSDFSFSDEDREKIIKYIKQLTKQSEGDI
ncbi:helix-turn-helix domain-containing protein [Tuberibacillus calidus]|uniref:helix-turn-helix domain-containing protein n=1 Tax=Tuberibacillus calidus TaxID=340097 RepID=UPI00056EACC3|nr:helix-turn-helix transcriptional regulator [Tuberibacillus calidus]